VDVETAVDKTLVTTEVVCIDTSVKGPLGHGLSALLLGRLSTSKQGIFVLPGVIDADFTGVVKVMVYTLAPPLSIPAGSRIAQLVPFRACVPHATPHHLGDEGFGSSGQPYVYLALDIMKNKPEIEVLVKSKDQEMIKLKMMIDTGADVTIISARHWPSHWPTVESFTGVYGVGGAQSTRISRDLVAFHFSDGAVVST